MEQAQKLKVIKKEIERTREEIPKGKHEKKKGK